MRRDGIFAQALKATGGSVASGAARAYAANANNPGLAPVPISKTGWIFDAAQLAVGVTGAALGSVTRDEGWSDWTQGVLQSGIAYASEDAAHEILRLVKGGTPASTAPKTVLRVTRTPGAQAEQVRARVTPVGPSASYTPSIEDQEISIGASA